MLVAAFQNRSQYQSHLSRVCLGGRESEIAVGGGMFVRKAQICAVAISIVFVAIGPCLVVFQFPRTAADAIDLNQKEIEQQYWLGWQNQNPQAHTVFVSILRVETPQDADLVCVMWLRGVVWSIHRDCIASFAFWFYTTQPIVDSKHGASP